MRYDHINGCRTIDRFVKHKLDELNRCEHSFENLFGQMFSEKEGVLYERSEGYRIVRTTYGQACDNVKKRAAQLRRLLPDAPYDGVVGIYMENSVAWIETFWAVLAAGFRPVLMNLRLDGAILHDTLLRCEVLAVIADEQTSFPVRTIVQEQLLLTDAPSDAPSDTPSDASCAHKAFGTQIFVMSTGTSSHVKVCGYDAEAFCHLVSDSYSIIRSCAQIKRHYNGQIKLLTFLPFYHVFGLIAMYIWFGFFSRTFVHLQNMEAQTIVNTIRRHEVTHIFAVPLFWEQVYERAMRTIRESGEKTVAKYEKGLAVAAKLERIPALARLWRKAAFAQVRERLFGKSVQFMISGGSPIRPDALHFFNDVGYHLCNGYGMTEIGITSVELSMSHQKRVSGSVGAPLPSIRYRIDECGELLVKGRSLAGVILQDGVWHNARDDEWFHTGDLASCADGSYHILGRSDDVILLANGEMLNPNLIEPRFLQEGVRGACLIDVGAANAAVPVLLLAVKKGCTQAQLALLRERALDRVAECKLEKQLKGVVFVAGSLLGERDFKLNRAAVKRRYLQGELQAVSNRNVSDAQLLGDLGQHIAALFAAVLDKPVEQIGYDSDFFMDEDGTSLDYFAMLSGLKEAYELPFEETEKTNFHTVRGVCAYIEAAEHARNA